MATEYPSDPQQLQLLHYKKFLSETAKSLGMADDELAQIDGFQSPDQINSFIDTLVKKYGVTKEQIHNQQPFNSQKYDEWDSL